MNVRDLLRANIKAMTPYSSARDEFDKVADVYLDANENPFENGMNRYPDPYQLEVKKRLSEIKGIAPEQMLLGNGSDEVLDIIFRAFCEPKLDNVISHNPSYGMYPVLSEINDVELRKVNLEEGFQLNAQAMIDASDDMTKLFFICSPNNPSGNLLKKEEIKKILDAQQGIVVIDEAYVDFAEEKSWIHELDNYPNLIVCQTLSKAWGLAGLRLGMCFASPEIIAIFNAIKPPYNVNVLSQKAALEVLNKESDFNDQVATILSERKKVIGALEGASCVSKVFPTDSNFVLARVDHANALYDFLLERKVIVRNRSTQYLCENSLRFTIGTPEENDRLIEGIKEYESTKGK